MLNYTEAYQLIQSEFKNIQTGTEETGLTESYGRVLAEDIYSGSQLPSFDNSAMDGICVKYTGGISGWKIAGEISAGNFHAVTLNDTGAAVIMTGAEIPAGCDTVIPVEDIEISGGNAVLKKEITVTRGQHIRKAGQDLKQGEKIGTAGSVIRPVDIALFAACGYSKLKVLKKLNFAALATGDELVDISETPVNDKLRASNLYALISLVESTGMNCKNCGIVKDDHKLIIQQINSAVDGGADIILTTGGVSAGKYDFMQDALKELGAEILFWKVNIKPGKPLLFAKTTRRNRTVLLFGLPGNPVSAIVNYITFVKRAVIELFCKEDKENHRAVLLNDIKKHDGKRHFIRGYAEYNPLNGLFGIRTGSNQSSSNMAGLSSSNALAVIREETTNPEAGEFVECIML